MDWEDARALHALARGGSMLAASKLLSVSHATISRRIARLEGSLEGKIVDRVAGGASLTPLGERLAASAERMGEEADSLLRIARGAKDELTGKVVIAAPPGLSVDIVVPACVRVASKYPSIAIHVRAAMAQVSLDRLEADLAIRLVKPEASSHARRLIGELEYGFYARSDLVAVHADLRWIGYSKLIADLPERLIVEAAAGDLGISLEFDDIAGQTAAICAGLGKGLLPNYVARKRPELAQIPNGENVLRRQIWLAQHLDVRKSASVRAVADALVEQLAQDDSFRRV